ncbi:lysophospholipid acyltransferase family protein [Microbacteriaceae bacterium 4G12]
MYRFVMQALNVLFRIFSGKIFVSGKEKVPASEAFVLVCTHRSWLDVVCLGVALYPTPVHYMAKKELFKKKLIGDFLTNVNAFPVDREKPGPSTLKIPLQLLKKDKVVGIFPSGTRSAENASLKNGAVFIASRANVPIVPAVYIGPHNMKDVLKRKKKQIIFGEPLCVPQPTKGKDDTIQQATENLLHVLNNLEKKHI